MAKIAIDPGHGGFDPGAIGPAGLREANVNLAVATRTAQLLRDVGQEVWLTRDSNQLPWDRNKDLSARFVLANSWGVDYYVSVHCNAAANPAAHGTETYCYKFGGQGEQLARAIQTELITATGLADRGVKEANFAVLKGTNMPAVLVELAFISNPAEEQLLANPDFQERCAQAVAQGILSFLGVQQPPAQPADPNLVWIKVGGQVLEGRLIGDTTWGPVRDIAEALGKTVYWDGKKMEVVIQ